MNFEQLYDLFDKIKYKLRLKNNLKKISGVGVLIVVFGTFQNCGQQRNTEIPKKTDTNSLSQNNIIRFDKDTIKVYENQNSISVSLSEASAYISVEVNYRLLEQNGDSSTDETSLGKFSGSVVLSSFMKTSEITLIGIPEQYVNLGNSTIFLEISYFHERQVVVNIPIIFKNTSSINTPSETGSINNPMLSSQSYSKLTRPMKIRFLSNYFYTQQPCLNADAQAQGNFEFEIIRYQKLDDVERLTYEIKPLSPIYSGQKFVSDNLGILEFQAGEQKKLISLKYPSLNELRSAPYLQNNLRYLLKISKGDEVVADRIISLESFYGVQLNYRSTSLCATELIFSYNPVRFFSAKVDNKDEERTCQLCPDFEHSMDGWKAHNIPFLAYDYQLYQLTTPVTEGSRIVIKGELELDAVSASSVILRDSNQFMGNNVRMFYSGSKGVNINPLTNEVLIELTTDDLPTQTNIERYPLTVMNFWCKGANSGCGTYDGYLPSVSQTVVLPFQTK